MSDIFLSYASADRPRVMPLVDALRQRGWSVWWDRGILPGKTWDQVIEAELAGARCVIVLWSRNSIQSDWVRTEAEEAKRRGILVPVLLDNVSIPLAFRRIQAANLVNWSGALPNAAFDELAQAVSGVLPSVAAPAPVERTGAQTRGRRPLLLIGGFVLACIAGLAWYFETPHRNAAPKPGTELVTKLVPGLVRANSKDGQDYVWIPSGTFTMGCSPGDGECFPDEKPPHEVTITHGFWLGKTEVTEAAYYRFWSAMGKPDQRVPSNPGMPVANVSWDEAKAYCEWAGLRLPREAEWEYAARAHTTGPRYGALNAVAWWEGNSGTNLRPVGGKQPNGWGLNDMLGNASEWIADWYEAKYYEQNVTTDPAGPPTGSYRVLRGGTSDSPPEVVRASTRGFGDPELQLGRIGVRCAGDLR